MSESYIDSPSTASSIPDTEGDIFPLLGGDINKNQQPHQPPKGKEKQKKSVSTKEPEQIQKNSKKVHLQQPPKRSNSKKKEAKPMEEELNSNEELDSENEDDDEMKQNIKEMDEDSENNEEDQFNENLLNHPVRKMPDFSSIYMYYYEKGLKLFLLNRFVYLFSIIYVIIFSLFAFVFIRWDDLLSCPAEKCSVVQIVAFPTWRSLHWWHLLVLFFDFGCFVFFCRRVFTVVQEVQKILSIRQYFLSELKIDDEKLQVISWEEVAERILEVEAEQPNFKYTDEQSHKEYVIDQKLIHNFIMRQDNFIISLLAAKKLDFTNPFSRFYNFVFQKTNETPKNVYLSDYLINSLQDYLSECIFDGNHRFTDKVTGHKIEQLQMCFRKFALRQLLLSIPMFFYILFYNLFQYAADIKNSGFGSLTKKKWTTEAKWKFRLFNELPHSYELRLKKAVEPANEYLKEFPDFFMSSVGNLLTFVLSSFILMLAIISLLKSQILLNSSLLGQNLLWWATIFGTVYLALHGLVIEENRVFEAERKLKEVRMWLLHSPKTWKGKGNHPEVCKEFSAYFRPTYELLIQELLAIITTPLVFYFSLPESTKKMTDFFNNHHKKYSNIGFISSYGCFDLKRTRISQREIENYQKMEKSVFDFMKNYPYMKISEVDGTKQLFEKAKSAVKRRSVLFEDKDTSSNPQEPSKDKKSKESSSLKNIASEEEGIGEFKKQSEDSDLSQSVIDQNEDLFETQMTASLIGESTRMVPTMKSIADVQKTASIIEAIEDEEEKYEETDGDIGIQSIYSKRMPTTKHQKK